VTSLNASKMSKIKWRYHRPHWSIHWEATHQGPYHAVCMKRD